MSLSGTKSAFAANLKSQIKAGIKTLNSKDNTQTEQQLYSLCEKLANAIMDNVNNWLQANKKVISVDPGSHTEIGPGSGVIF